MKPGSVICAGLCLAAAVVSTNVHAGPATAELPVESVRSTPPPDTSLGYRQASPYPTLAWALLQLIPSPELAVGRPHRGATGGFASEGPTTAFGMRWQMTPLLWSFGVHRSQSRWRYFVVDPFARVSGSLELSTSFEYIGGHVDRFLARPGLRVYLPLSQKGEYLSTSFGTSVYSYEGMRVAYDVGAYILAGLLGFQVTIAPAHAPLAAIATINLRYF